MKCCHVLLADNFFYRVPKQTLHKVCGLVFNCSASQKLNRLVRLFGCELKTSRPFNLWRILDVKVIPCLQKREQNVGYGVFYKAKKEGFFTRDL